MNISTTTTKMDGFSYNNIFETKGIEYLIIIAFLLLIIPFWIMINRQISIKSQIRNAIGTLSEGILKIPLGLLFSKNHTWTHLEKTGVAEVGIDDFLLHITGEVKFSGLKAPGSFINKGELLADIDHNGKILKVYSPISGKVTATNKLLTETPEMVSEDPYNRGLIYKMTPASWIEETDTYYMANEALAWSRIELQRFKDFLALSARRYTPEVSMVLMQDGGELCDNPLSGLPDEIWHDFQKSFLDDLSS
ncbi:MAG: glycine cleavage system protein H [Bacteroidales bacterium]|nr:glycine cleavage system protein H [Bacteroidales bacterium]